MIIIHFLSNFFTNVLSFLFGIFITDQLISKQTKLGRQKLQLILLLSLGSGLLCSIVGQIAIHAHMADYITGYLEILLLYLACRYLHFNDQRLCLFIMITYEIGTSMYQFIFGAILNCLCRSDIYTNQSLLTSVIPIWITRILVLTGTYLYIRKKEFFHKYGFRIMCYVAFAGIFSIILLATQQRYSLDSNNLNTWQIFSTIFFTMIFIFHMRTQIDAEKKINQLKLEQTELLERDYNTLNQAYASHARLFHDFHNHINMLQYLLQNDKKDQALEYLNNLQAPVNQPDCTVWSGDSALDYLINSKLTLAKEHQITTSVNIEFPHNMMIHSMDLCTIIGNLLDNSLEALEHVPQSDRQMNFKIRRINQMLIIKTENTCNLTPVSEEGTLRSMKENAEENLHGWGLNSVRAAALKYDGCVSTEYSNGTFTTIVSLNF